MMIEQHNFWHKSSCLASLICFMDEETGKMNRGRRVVCYLDFKKTSDSVAHKLFG